ncbi:hypothetical protein [Algoriphagus taiwanensis]|uniref:Uncharacterized protein n=1 Tax=Algoriphagus taiwanensis TaxID=1445656 RepID=A0ABQ6Q1U1_9BACT|nr:hypothetical protein Ataiwa_17920 [Algoriphagus taiwanensis]
MKEVADFTEKKYISFDGLKRLSDENFERFNRNIDYENFEKNHEIKPNIFKMTILAEHSYSMGSPTENHYRCLVTHPNISEILIQDISVEQWDRINK